MAATLLVGMEDRESAKKRRKQEYKQDLELQIKERQAAKERERLQDMNVNASGWLDPEKGPERFKPLGGVHWTQERGKREDRVRPYHTLFLYGRVPVTSGQMVLDQSPRSSDPLLVTGRSPRLADGLELHRRTVRLGTPAGLRYHPVTNAGAGVNSNPSVDQAYNFFATRDLDYGPPAGGAGGSIVQPISIPHVDNRPIIVTGQNGGNGYQGPRFNPFENRGDDGGTARELRHLLDITQVEKDRLRRDNDDFQRRLRQELEDERRKLNDQEAEARRRLEDMRRDAEERRREAERQRREAERLRREAETRPKSNPIRPASKKTMLYYDMDDYRLRLIEERKRIEELLKAGKPKKEVWDLKVIQKPRLNLPPTPKTADRANRDNIREFNDLKYRDFNARNQFRDVYPDVPYTNRRLEQQQEALLRQQEIAMRDYFTGKPKLRQREIEIPPRRAISRPSWLDRNPTPFPHVLKKRDKMYTAHSWDGDLDTIHRRNQEREKVLGNVSSTNEDAVLDELKLRNHRPFSADTLTDDTWLRPSSTTEV